MTIIALLAVILTALLLENDVSKSSDELAAAVTRLQLAAEQVQVAWPENDDVAVQAATQTIHSICQSLESLVPTPKP